jgi:AcrR family transcriptional regulator
MPNAGPNSRPSSGDRHGARAPLTRERIVDAALEVADAEGIDALTLRRLAEALDVHPTSIYHHLASKEAILDALTERLMTEAALPPVFDDWRDWVRTFAGAMRRLARAHAGGFMVLTRRPADGPVASDHSEAAIEAFCRTGWAPDAAAYAVRGVALAVLGLSLNECEPVRPSLVRDVTHLSPERHPRIFEAFESMTRGQDALWETVVEALIRGLEAR